MGGYGSSAGVAEVGDGGVKKAKLLQDKTHVVKLTLTTTGIT